MSDQPSCTCDKLTGFRGEGKVRGVIYTNFSMAFNIVLYHVLECKLGH